MGFTGSLGNTALHNLTTAHIIKLHDIVAKMGAERCPTGTQSVYWTKPLDELVTWLRVAGARTRPLPLIGARILTTIIQRQPFQDCNHRTAYALTLEIFGFFGMRLSASPEEIKNLLADVYRGRITESALEKWLGDHLCALNSTEPRSSSTGASSLSTRASSESKSVSKSMNEDTLGDIKDLREEI